MLKCLSCLGFVFVEVFERSWGFRGYAHSTCSGASNENHFGVAVPIAAFEILQVRQRKTAAFSTIPEVSPQPCTLTPNPSPDPTPDLGPQTRQPPHPVNRPVPRPGLDIEGALGTEAIQVQARLEGQGRLEDLGFRIPRFPAWTQKQTGARNRWISLNLARDQGTLCK